ncbi:FkbM family methyltransferase [Massilibacteroides sp.]|uniref:FkbM family methyltransferase n=1 Tax=Massilibacteroides sp. TaxID=2034766 RepID=UPI00262401F4|nr:FkbM family methyltransferase [Massilibacteroides sp.]MDD4515368.1 FkbM family methyltransferase [Massilibacteroides sp.]
MNYFTKIYRTYVSEHTREKIYKLFLKDILYVKRNFDVLVRAKMTYYLFPLLPKTEKNELFRFMGKHELTSYPWPFVSEYERPIDCFYDEQHKMYYVLHNQKRLYFPIHFTEAEVLDLYKTLLIEQDRRSPHRYLEDYSPLNGHTVLDIGAAEGIFSLNVIESIQHSYLFECEPYWIDALKVTFSPWAEKVTIIPRYVSNVDSETEITIDTFLKDKTSKGCFIKMDIEGAELSALHGAEQTLKSKDDVFLSVCTYHSPSDAKDISAYLSSLNYSYSFTEGFLFFNKHLNKAILRATKKSYA